MVSIDYRLDSISKQPYLKLGGLVPWPRVDKTGKSKLSSVPRSKQPKQLPHSLSLALPSLLGWMAPSDREPRETLHPVGGCCQVFCPSSKEQLTQGPSEVH